MPLATGARLGNYEVLGPLGKGGMREGPSWAKASFEAGWSTELFDAHMRHSANNLFFEYDVTADGKRFLINTTGAGPSSTLLLTVVTNWQAGLKK